MEDWKMPIGTPRGDSARESKPPIGVVPCAPGSICGFYTERPTSRLPAVTDTSATTEICFLDSIDECPPAQWNALLDASDSPFLRHEFLSLLEQSGCVGGASGWLPRHALAGKAGAVVGACPAYVKHHSYGEYVFDWAWARAYQQHGHPYYPKLVVGVPFTPVTGRRLLARPDAPATSRLLLDALRRHAEAESMSSLHALFLEPSDAALCERAGMLPRHDVQFQWRNEGYRDFDDFLDRFTSKKRKNIRAERRKVREAGIHFEFLTPAGTSPEHWRSMFDFYQDTVTAHGGMPYLNLAFFQGLPERMPDHVRLLLGTLEDRAVCGALFFENSDALYGRYWGAAGYLDNLHFETCYYQPIEYAISRGLSRFEAGAQGTHKLSRGLIPAQTRSAHWLRHPGFADAVSRYLELERGQQDEYARSLVESGPFRRDPGR